MAGRRTFWFLTRHFFQRLAVGLVAVPGVMVTFMFIIRSIPIVRTYYPGKKNAAILAGVYIYGFSAFTASMPLRSGHPQDRSG